MTEWIDWENHPVPEDIRGFFIKYESGFIDCDRYDHETKKRKYRDEKIVSWEFMERPKGKSVKA